MRALLIDQWCKEIEEKNIDMVISTTTIGEEHTLIISVEGGGTTYETLSYTSITEGDSVV